MQLETSVTDVHWAPEADRAVLGLEMGHVVKLVLAFKERFWERDFRCA